MDNRPLSDNFYQNIKPATTYINKLYDKTTFADNYGSSILICILVTLFVLTVFLYCLFMQKKQEIYADWNNNRCKPQYIPIAGFIAAPEGQSIGSYTSENFQYCLNAQATNLTGYAMQPIMYMLGVLVALVAAIQDAINSMRGMLSKFRDNIAEFTKVVMGKILNIMTPIIHIFIALIDSLQKTQGVMATCIFTLLSVYYALQALIGSIFEIMGKTLLLMIIIIAICWALPFTIPTAIGLSAVYIVIAAIISVLMVTYVLIFGIKVLKIPKLRCFDKNVQVKMGDGSIKNMMDVQVGDILEHETKVTAKMKLDASDLRMFNINGVVVSESHVVKYGSKWIYVRDHPGAVEIFNYGEPYLYCLNTSSKQIVLNDTIFTDWDEIYDETLTTVLNSIPIKTCENIHKYLDVGFDKDMLVDLVGDTNKKIKDIKVGDILLCGSSVCGIVEIEKSELANYELSLGNSILDEMKLYHLLTTDEKFSSNGRIIPDYNDHIDKLTNKK